MIQSSLIPSANLIVSACLLFGLTNISLGQSSECAFFIREGLSYYNVPGESRLGNSFAVEGAFPLSENFGITGSAQSNWISTGTQYSGSIGLVKVPGYCPSTTFDRMSLAILFDQFSDTRIDTIGSSFYANQIRLQGGYAWNDAVEFGVNSSIPIEEASNVQFRFVSFPGSLPTRGRVDMATAFGTYIGYRCDNWQQTMSLGYRDLPGTMQYGTTTRYKLNDQFSLNSSAAYEMNRGNWSLFFGCEVSLGPKTRPCGCCDDGCTYGCVSNFVQTNDDVTSADSNIQLVAYVPPGNVTEIPETSLGDYPLGLGQDTPQNIDLSQDDQALNDFPYDPDLFRRTQERQFRYRYSNWLGRQELNHQERSFYATLTPKGLLNEAQNNLQSQFTEFVIQDKGGEFLRRDAAPNR